MFLPLPSTTFHFGNRTESVRVASLLDAILRPKVLFFFVDIIVFGSGMAIVERLVFLYLLNDLHVCIFEFHFSLLGFKIS